MNYELLYNTAELWYKSSITTNGNELNSRHHYKVQRSAIH